MTSPVYIIEGRRNSQSQTWDRIESTTDQTTANDYAHINLQLGWRKYRITQEGGK